MLKYGKWIILGILIIMTTMLGLKFINYSTHNSVAPKGENIDFSLVKSTTWTKIGIAFYQDGELITKNMKLSLNKYIIFYEDHVEYTNRETGEVNKYKYTYENGILEIDSEKEQLPKGVYRIEFDGEKLKFSQGTDEEKIVYYFDASKG